MGGLFLMNKLQETIEALKKAEQYLDEYVADPTNYNNPMATALEIISWDIGNKISEIKERQWYGC